MRIRIYICLCTTMPIKLPITNEAAHCRESHYSGSDCLVKLNLYSTNYRYIRGDQCVDANRIEISD